MIAILTEPAYSGSIWCKQLLESLKNRLKQKRIPFHEVSDSIDETDDGVFILASDYHWIKETVTRLNAAGIKPILICNQAEQIHGCDYSCVCSDIGGSMKYLLEELKRAGRTRVALYGINTSSISDIGRVDGLFAFKDDSFNEMRIFTNTGSLQNCFAEFFGEYKNFDAVICSNDFAAVSLVRNLLEKAPDALEALKILSCAQTKLSAYYKARITSVDMHFEQYGKAAVFLYEALKAHPYMAGMTVTVNWNDENEKTPRHKPVTAKNEQSGSAFYADGEMRDLLGRDSLRRVTYVADTPSAETREALLSYETLGTVDGLSLVRVQLHTGRTHQIRVQFASRGLPLAGDRKYGLPEDDAPLALWAYQLSFTHPQTDKEMTFTCPPPETAPWVRFALPAEK